MGRRRSFFFILGIFGDNFNSLAPPRALSPPFVSNPLGNTFVSVSEKPPRSSPTLFLGGGRRWAIPFGSLILGGCLLVVGAVGAPEILTDRTPFLLERFAAVASFTSSSRDRSELKRREVHFAVFFWNKGMILKCSLKGRSTEPDKGPGDSSVNWGVCDQRVKHWWDLRSIEVLGLWQRELLGLL